MTKTKKVTRNAEEVSVTDKKLNAVCGGTGTKDQLVREEQTKKDGISETTPNDPNRKRIDPQL